MPNQNNNTKSLEACNPLLNATVSASAGSGKTWLLITRIVRLLIDGAEPGNIIALTFTRKAASEMQLRLSQRLFEMATCESHELEKILSQIGCDANKKTKLIATNLYEKLTHSLHPIRIQTFHSFCQDILARFPLEADIPPGFELLEDNSLLERQAWQELFSLAAKQLNNKQSALSDALDTIMQACNGPDNTYTALHNFLSHRSDWWAYTAKTDKPVEFASNALIKTLQLENTLNENDLSTQFINDNQEKISTFAGLLQEIKNVSSNKHGKTITDALNLLNQDAPDKKQIFTLLSSAFIKKDGEPLVQGRQYNPALVKKLGEENANRFVDLHHEISDSIQNIEIQIKRIFTLAINKAWYFTGNQYVEIYQQLKREMRLLDFTDLEWKCFQLLQQADNAHWVQYKIDQRINHLLIDEFQDTNPTQWNLLAPILEEIAANPDERARSVFLVGDEKQSIYSFRRANPALQAQASHWLATNLNAHATPLDFSRRSSFAIINGVNKVFEQEEIKSIMLNYATHDTYLDTLPGQIHLYDLFFDNSQNTIDLKLDTPDTIYFRNPLLQPREQAKITLRHKEAENIAKQILRLKETPEFITKDEEVRPVDYGDILILMRNRTHVSVYEEALKQHGIPFIGSKKGGLLDNIEIQDLTCLLNTLITPYNNLALAQVLKSPIFNACDEDLILLAQHGKKHWYESLLELTTETKSSCPLQRAAKLLPHWKTLSEQLPVHDCLDKIFSEGNIVNRYIAANRSENKQKVAANCQRFLELSLEVDSGRYPSITRFLQRISHLTDYSESPPEEPLPKTDGSYVKIMTIHASKGLEAPIVFLVDCNSTSKNKNAYNGIVDWPAEKSQPVRFQLQVSKDKTDDITQKLQQEKIIEQTREELNLLYVALTRAREQLYISGVENSKKHNNSWYKIIRSGLESITAEETDSTDTTHQAYRHLKYANVSNKDKDKDKDKDNLIKQIVPNINKQLLTPIEQVPLTNFLLTPSSVEDKIKPHNQTEMLNTSDQSLAKWKGILIHKTIEQLCQDGHYPATQHHIDNIKQRLHTETSRHNPSYLEHLDSCMNEAQSAFEHSEFKEIFNHNSQTNAFNEMPIMYKANKQAVYGIIDRVIVEKENVMIIDYKSHRLAQGESAKEVAQQFNQQLKFYQEGVKKIWPMHHIKTGVLFTYHKELIWL